MYLETFIHMYNLLSKNYMYTAAKKSAQINAIEKVLKPKKKLCRFMDYMN